MSEALLEGERSWGRTYLVRQGQAGGSVRVHHIGEGSSDINPDELLGLLVGGAGPNVYARRRAPSLHRKARPVRERESNPGRNPTAPEGVPLLGDAPGRPVGRDNLNPRHGLGGAANAAPHLHRALGFRSSASSANTGADLCSKVFATSVSSCCPDLTWQRRNQEGKFRGEEHFASFFHTTGLLEVKAGGIKPREKL